EDKRKRNTAASARFRIKKKQREQSMEKTVQEMTEKSTGLENRVKELELEIKFLRGLLI
ncbi:basic-leucine zipper transcription factor, partial [Mucor lusitanicus CBS 277.49]